MWLIGYTLGIILFFIVPPSMVGWVIMPIGAFVTLWVLFRRIKGDSLRYFFFLAIIWTLIAVIFDYFFIVKLLQPVDFYYKLDVCLSLNYETTFSSKYAIIQEVAAL